MQSSNITSLGGGNLLKRNVNSNTVIQLGNLLKLYDDGVDFTVFASLDLYNLKECRAVLATSVLSQEFLLVMGFSCVAASERTLLGTSSRGKLARL